VTPALAARLSALHHAAFAADSRGWSAEEIAALAGAAGAVLALAGTEAQPEGFALGRAVAGEAELLTIAVRPEARRRGHGAALLRAVERDAAARGAATLFLEVSERNAAACALYRRFGYVARGRRPLYYGDADALLLSKDLPQARP
jgi:ribosomal-protein-alanine N-acetyltransferase